MTRDNTSNGYGRRRAIKGSAALTALALAGCIGTTDDETGDDTTDGEESGEGTESDGVSQINGWGWDVAARSLQLTATEYEAEHDVTVDVEEFGREAMKEDLQTRLSSGSGAPDFAMLEMVDGASYIDTGAIHEVSDRIESAGIHDDFVEGTWESLSEGDEIYALPWDIGPTAVYYRRDVYDEHGVDPDAIETWDDFIEEGEKLPDDVDMLNLPMNDLDGVWRYQFRQLGNDPFTDDGAVNIGNDDSVMIAETMKELHDRDLAATLDGWSSAWFSAYAEGDVASLPSAAWMEGTLRDELPDTHGDWGVYKIPAHEAGGPRASNWGGSSLMIPEQIEPELRDAAWDFIEFTLATEEMQLLMYAEYGLFPALETAYGADTFDEEVDFFGGQQARGVFAEVAEEMPGYRFSADTPEVSNAINSEFQLMLNEDKDPEAAVQDAAETVAERTGRDLA